MVVEFQTEPDADMNDRLLEYLARLQRELRYGPNRNKYQVVATLVNLTGTRQADRLEMWLPGMSEIGVELGVKPRTMREEGAEATLAGIAEGRTGRCMLPWIPLMRGAGELSIIEQWKQLGEMESDDRRRSDYAGLALVFAELTGLRPIWKQALEGWNVRQSQQVLEWQAEARIEGRKEGRAEGQLETKRADLLCLIQLKFHEALPSDLVDQIDATTNLEVLTRWFDQAVQANSLDAFRAVVQADS